MYIYIYIPPFFGTPPVEALNPEPLRGHVYRAGLPAGPTSFQGSIGVSFGV